MRPTFRLLRGGVSKWTEQGTIDQNSDALTNSKVSMDLEFVGTLLRQKDGTTDKIPVSFKRKADVISNSDSACIKVDYQEDISGLADRDITQDVTMYIEDNGDDTGRLYVNASDKTGFQTFGS